MSSGNELPPSSYPDLSATSPTDSVIAGDFGSLSAEEQERQRDEWKSELAKTEEEIVTLKQVLASKEIHAQGLKRRLGITQWREFSEDMAQGLKSLQETAAYKRTAEGLSAARNKTASMWTSVSSSTSGWTLGGMTEKMGSAIGAAKSKVSASFSHHGLSEEAVKEHEEAETKKKESEANGSGDKVVSGQSTVVPNEK